MYQDLALCDNLDVVQNMYLGREVQDCLFRLNEPAMEQRTAETLKALASRRSARSVSRSRRSRAASASPSPSRGP